MYENFTVSIPVLTRYPEKAYTLLTSTFSHRDLGHFVFNMVTFHTFASILRYRGITGPQLLTLYIGSGIVGSLGFVINEALNARRSQGDRRIHTALGASGAVMGLGATAALLAPSTQILIFFIPAPLWLAVSGYLAVDWFYMNDPRTRTAHAGHIGGALFGAAYWFIRLKGRRL
ncbi:rhomboid-domain-containing protein [Patellaria atrata CBS 101060]|uniref:Rhomboid-domain-containing protein n=1 Tax=Patellaria atrata CBS 101060 TaxID=1346257 RepID=A0A9P4S5E6_9PEZI|nr:rhomboid-domain-containing protein [Patellaria atrata CBS 101060]